MKRNSRIMPALLCAGMALYCTAAAAGRIPGPGQVKDVVSRLQSDVYVISFDGQEAADIYVSGDGDSDLDLYIYDDHDNLICRDEDSTDTMLCSWMPDRTGQFTVKIRNRGAANAYTLLTN